MENEQERIKLVVVDGVLRAYGWHVDSESWVMICAAAVPPDAEMSDIKEAVISMMVLSNVPVDPSVIEFVLDDSTGSPTFNEPVSVSGILQQFNNKTLH